MTNVTLRCLHAYLRLLENPSELKRKMPTSSTHRTMREGVLEIARLVGMDHAVFKDPQTIAALVGAPRFVMMGGEPSVTDHVALVFDSTRVLWTVLIDPARFETVPMLQSGPGTGAALQPAAVKMLADGHPGEVHAEVALDHLKGLLSGKLTVSCRLFRTLFEHLLGFVTPAIARQGNVLLVGELTGTREHSRSFLSTALFVLGAEVDRDALVAFMVEQGLLGLPLFEHMLRGRNYCEANYLFRRLERAFIGSPADEELRLRERINQLTAMYGAKPAEGGIREADGLDKARVDACLAATDLLEALALTPWGLSLERAIAVASSNCLRSIRIIARHFERFANGVVTQEQANQEIADHLLAFARQFSIDSRPV